MPCRALRRPAAKGRASRARLLSPPAPPHPRQSTWNTAGATAAETARATGCRVRAVDVRPCNTGSVPFARDDVFAPDFALYRGAEVIYVVRPGVEMVPALVALARACACDLLVYHLGNEIYLDGGERIAAGGVVLHRYYRAPSEEG